MKTIRTYTIVAVLILSICGTCFGAYAVGQPASFDSEVVKQSTGRLQTNPVVAGETDSFMAVWVDMRDAGNIADLFAAHIGPTGTVLDPGNIRLTNHACVLGRPDICFNGQEYFVVYANAVGAVGNLIYGIRLSADGAILSQQPIVISSYHSECAPRVSWDGANWIVIWSGDGPQGLLGVYAVRLTPTGTVLDSAPINIAPGSPTWDGFAATNPAVASTPTGRSLIVWCRNSVSNGTSNDLWAAELVGDTGVVNTSGVPVYAGTTSQDTPDCCWAGDHFKAVWADGEPAGREIKGMRFDQNGALLDTEPWTVSSVTERQFDPQIAYNGHNCIVTWTRRVTDGADIYAGRLGAAGTALDGNGFAVCSADGRQARTSVALMSDETLQDSVLICWTDDRGPTMVGFGTQVVEAVVNVAEGTPSVGTERRLAESASQHKPLCSAYNGQRFLVCWEEWTEAGRTLKGALADPNTGQPIASTPFEIMPIPDAGIGPRAIWNGENFILVWVDGSTLKALRISPSGTVLDPAPISIVVSTNGAPTGWSITTDGEKCLIAYRISTSKYRAALIRRDCSLVSDIGVYMGSSGYSGEIAACWAGQYYVLVWKHPTTSNAIAYTTITQAGALGTTRQFTDASSPSEFHLVWNGQTLRLISRGSEIHSYGGWDSVYKWFGTSPGVPPVPLVVTANATVQENMNFFWDGLDYVLTWTIANPDPACGAAMQSDLQFTRISSNNQLIGINGVNVLSSSTSEIGGTMCAGPTGRILAAYASYDDRPYQSTRAKGLYIDNQLSLTGLGELRGLYEGAYITIPNRVVSAGFPGDRFYVQYLRTFGIGVKSLEDCAAGSMVTFTGRLKKINGETLIDASTAQVLGTGNPIPRPLGLVIEDLGGIGPTPGYCTVTGASGPYNIGLRVKVWGRVTYSETGFFYLDDGSNVPTDPGRTGVKVYGTAPGSTYLEVTGISGSETSGDKIIRVIRSTDIEPVGGVPPPPPF